MSNLEIQHLTLTLRKSGRVLLKDFSLTLSPGDRAVIIGEEGNGKSTLLRAIAAPESLDGYCEMTGSIRREGLQIGYLEQELPSALYAQSAASFFAGTDIYQALTPRLWKLDFDPALLESGQAMGSLSGGEKVKLCLLRLLASRPDVLLLDEPTNDLDMEALEWLEAFLNALEIPALYVSHDETLIERTANLIVHLEQVRKKTVPRHTVERSGYGEYVRRRLAGLEKQEQVARKQRADYGRKMERYQQIYNRVEHEQRTISKAERDHVGQLLKKKMKAVKSMGRRFEREKEEFLEIPDVEDAISLFFPESVRLPRGKRVVDAYFPRLEAGGRLLAREIRLVVGGGEHIALVGRNGAGKTTLLRRLWDELRKRADLRAGWMPQNYGEALDERDTPVGFLAPGGRKEDVTRAFTGLGSLQFTHEEMTQPIGALSGGQRAKLLLLRLLLDGCNVLLLDEPTRNLSPLSNPVIRQALAAYGGTILSVTHDRKYIREVCTAVYELTENGLVPRDPLSFGGPAEGPSAPR
ncbi:MAG TPA: ATP-binding cassette domain-containing protein [Firmicutes bacterium]|nr:ATP-binding cassette domain-containing protein [Bacillota bacterium]